MKMLNNNCHSRTLVLCATALLLTFTGCKTSRRLTIAETSTAATKEASEFFFSLNGHSFQYRTLSARTQAKLSFSGKELSSRVDIKMVKDSVFQLSVQPLFGIEAFRIEFGLDSIKIIDRMNKNYAVESYAGLKGNTPVDFNFYNLQALFTNRIFVPGERDITPRQYGRFTLQNNGVVTEARIKDAMKLLYAFKADNEEKLLSTLVTDSSERYALQWVYADFKREEKQIFPMQMEARALNSGVTAGELKLSFSRIQRDIPVDMRFAIPDKYKRITFVDILKGLKEM
ncbi:MAG: DUF4292 domain-containing protein [Tannerellaceae bacterium]|jgi:hypothetical protein|nr:DUF4292 domain-containing protein [Tannerellaceae bacterium]